MAVASSKQNTDVNSWFAAGIEPFNDLFGYRKK
jgi:hypothetical protein